MRGSKMDLESRSPSPRPSPSGRGRAILHAQLFRGTLLQLPLSFRHRAKPHDKTQRSLCLKTAADSPSPGGAGRGEGERSTNLAVVNEFSQSLLTSAVTDREG